MLVFSVLILPVCLFLVFVVDNFCVDAVIFVVRFLFGVFIEITASIPSSQPAAKRFYRVLGDFFLA